jgi:GNAT superfamily N-acetyltransferase
VPELEIRPFRRDDREQLTALVNAHVAAVVPGVTVSVNAVMSQLEREPGETVVDPWVIERRTLVAVERDAIAAGAHLHRYGSGGEVSESFRNTGLIRWLVARHDATDAADALMAACIETMDGWDVRLQHASGDLPSFASYGVPSSWPHVRELYVRWGFVNAEEPSPYESIHVVEVERLPRTTEPPVDGLELRRSVGACGTRISAVLDGEVVGFVEVDLLHERNVHTLLGWADIGNLWVAEEHRRRGIATWLLGIAADWLRLGGVDRLLTYTWPSREDELAFTVRHGFRELVRTERGWTRR